MGPLDFSKNRDRLLTGDTAAQFLSEILAQPRVRRLLSTEHFSVDGTLVEAWPSMKSFQPRDDPIPPPDGGSGGRNPSAGFRGEKRSNATHASTTDPEAMLYRKGPGMEAKLCFIGHGLMENRSGLLIDARLTRVSGHAERLAALEMVEALGRGPRAITLGADRGYDAATFVEELRTFKRPPARRAEPQPALGNRPSHHPARELRASQRARKRIEEAFGWIKAVAGLRRTKLRGLDKVDWSFTFAAAAYNLIRLPKLLATTA